MIYVVWGNSEILILKSVSDSYRVFMYSYCVLLYRNTMATVLSVYV